MATRIYEEPEKKLRLIRDFERAEHFLAHQHDMALALGINDYATLAKNGAAAAAHLAASIMHTGRNPVSVFTNSADNQTKLVNVVDALNPILGLEKDNPARNDPTIRATMRRLHDFIGWLYDDGNCAKKVAVREFNVNARAEIRQAATAAAGLRCEGESANKPQAQRRAEPAATL